MRTRKSGKSGSFYAVVTAKRRGAKQFAMVISRNELQKLLAMHAPIYRQLRCRSMSEAAAAVEKICALLGGGVRQTTFDSFRILDEEKEICHTVREPRVFCFYDSEFGMYNYGEQQGDVVSIGAVVLPHSAVGQNAVSQDTDANAAAAAEEEVRALLEAAECRHEADMFAARFSSLIQNRNPQQLSERFRMFTHMDPALLYDAPPFPEVYEAFRAFVREQEIDVIYCLGNNDQERLSALMERYGYQSAEDKELLLKFQNFQRWLYQYDARLSGVSLETMKELCQITDETLHDAMGDAESLARIYLSLREKKPTDKQVRAAIEAGRLRSKYRKSRRISFERLAVSREILAYKEKLMDAIAEENQRTKAVPAGVLRAICDDLDALLIEAETEEEKEEMQSESGSVTANMIH